MFCANVLRTLKTRYLWTLLFVHNLERTLWERSLFAGQWRVFPNLTSSSHCDPSGWFCRTDSLWRISVVWWVLINKNQEYVPILHTHRHAFSVSSEEHTLMFVSMIGHILKNTHWHLRGLFNFIYWKSRCYEPVWLKQASKSEMIKLEKT